MVCSRSAHEKQLAVRWIATAALLAWLGSSARAADVVPTDVQMPGTQPGEVSSLQTANRCDNCHGGYDPAVEPAHLWNGSVMAHSAADPLFWATLAVAEQDFDGAGDLCLRCHTPNGWLAGRSTPTDGSTLSPSNDSDGVECDLCHRLTDPVAVAPEPVGVQNAPFVAITGSEAHYGSGQYVMYGGNDKLGPYDDADARHSFLQSSFYRSSEMCGTCHDVSNPVVGNLSPNNGTQDEADPVVADGTLGGPVTGKAAFNNPPYRFGVVERTYSELMASDLSTTLVSEAELGNPTSLPEELKDGAILAAYTAAFDASGQITTDYADGTPRYFTCQSCHMMPASGPGCDKAGAPVRADLPLHDLSGGGFWTLDLLQWMDGQGTLTFGGGFSAAKLAAMADGAQRARDTLSRAAKLSFDAGTNAVTVTNLTGHKLPTGYPEGRRMWLRVTYKDAGDQTLRVDGEYGPLQVQMDVNGDSQVDANDTVDTLLDLGGTGTRIYEVHMGITEGWASALLALGYDPNLAIDYDRLTGAVTTTLQDVANQPSGTAHESFRFALNDKVVSDNRPPPYRMNREVARQRNVLPVPSNQFGNPGPIDFYDHFDVVQLDPRPGAVSADLELLYQTTSWEYIQFLVLANDGQNPLLADAGNNLLEGWYNTGMAPPHVMASETVFLPEPGELVMLGSGLCFVLLIGRRRVRAA